MKRFEEYTHHLVAAVVVKCKMPKAVRKTNNGRGRGRARAPPLPGAGQQTIEETMRLRRVVPASATPSQTHAVPAVVKPEPAGADPVKEEHEHEAVIKPDPVAKAPNPPEVQPDPMPEAPDPAEIEPDPVLEEDEDFQPPELPVAPAGDDDDFAGDTDAELPVDGSDEEEDAEVVQPLLLSPPLRKSSRVTKLREEAETPYYSQSDYDPSTDMESEEEWRPTRRKGKTTFVSLR